MKSPQNFMICPPHPPPFPSPPVEICLKCESPSNRTSLIAFTPAPNGKDFLLRHSLKGNILSASYDYKYIQQGVRVTKSSHIKVPSQVSFIDCLVFKQQKTI